MDPLPGRERRAATNLITRNCPKTSQLATGSTILALSGFSIVTTGRKLPTLWAGKGDNYAN